MRDVDPQHLGAGFSEPSVDHVRAPSGCAFGEWSHVSWNVYFVACCVIDFRGRRNNPFRYRTGTAVPVRGVIFDLGSTLIYRTGLDLEREKCAALAAYAAADLRHSDSAALAEHLLRNRLDAWRRAEAEQVEYLATRTIAEVFAARGLPTDDATLRRAEGVFFKPEVRASRLYPGARETLAALAARGLRLALISNATSHQLIVDITRKLGIVRYFDPLVTSAGFGRPKPHPSIFMHVLEAWGLSPIDAVMIGDTLGADILGANTVGLRSILVDIEPNPDNPRFAEVARPSAQVTTLRDVLDLLQTWGTTS